MPGPYERLALRQTSGRPSQSEHHPSHNPEHHLVHLPDELVDVGFPVAEVSTLNVVLELACPPAASGVRELERPEEVARLHGLY